MTTTQTYKKALIGNISAIKIAEDSLAANLELAGIRTTKASGNTVTVYASRKGIAVSTVYGSQGRTFTGFTRSKEYTWEELAKRIEFLSHSRAFKLPKGKVFHTVDTLDSAGKPYTYCGNGTESKRYGIDVVSNYKKSGFLECANCKRARTLK